MTKKRRSLFIVFGVICVCVLSSAFVLAGCGGKHKFKGDWVSDESGHWKECTKHDDCGEIDGPYEHVWDDGVVTVEPTCAEGKMTYTCTECGYTTTKVLAATDEHTFTISETGEGISWSWSTSGTTATATAVCGKCGETVSLDVAMSSEVDDDGNTVYTATVTINGTTYTATNIVEGAEPENPGTTTHEHNYVIVENPTWTWSTDSEGNDICYAAAVCTNDDGLCDATSGYVYAEITDGSSDATCTEPAYTWKVATYGGVEVSSTIEDKNASGEALGHDFVVAESAAWMWKDNTYAYGTASGTCSRCRETGTVEVASTTSTVDPTCAECGKTVYTVTYGDKEVLTKTVDNENAQATGEHTFGANVVVTWDWKQDTNGDWTATATFASCSVCNQTVDYTAEIITPAGGETLGTYTATVTVGGVPYTDHKEVGRVIHDPEDAYFELGEDKNKVYYENDSELTIVYNSTSQTYTITGPAAIMTEAQAKAYNGGSLDGQAQVGSNYILYGIQIQPGETLTGGTITEGVKNEGEKDIYYPILMLLTKTSGSRTYTLTDASGNTVDTVTVSFSGVVLKGTDSSYIELNPTDNTFTEGGVAFTNTTNFTAVLNEDGEWVLTGLASTMDHDQAEAYGITDGTSFVVYAVMIPAGATLTNLSNNDTKKNEGTAPLEYTICMGLSKTDGSRSYQIVAQDGTTTIVTVSFAGVILPKKGTESSWITVAPTDNTFSESDVQFTNTDGFTAELIDGVWVLTGLANTMDHAQAEAYGITDGTSYVVYAIMVPGGATLYDLRNGKEFTNDKTDAVEYTVCMGLSTNTGYRAYKIVAEDGTVTIVTVSFSGVDLPVQGTAETWITVEPVDATFDGSDIEFSNTDNFTVELIDDEFVLTGLANTMTYEQAEAWGTKAGESYVVYAINVPAYATLYDLRKGTVYVNNSEATYEYTICMGLSKNTGYRAYKIVGADGTVTIVTVSFAGVTLPTRSTTDGTVITNPTDNKFPGSDIEFSNKEGFTVVLNEETGEWVLTGDAASMSDEQAEAWGTVKGTAYVVYAIIVPAGATIYDLKNGTEYTNDDDGDYEYTICMGLSRNTGYRSYKIVDADGNVSIVTVTFADVELPDPVIVSVALSDPEITLDLNGTSKTVLSVVITMSDGTVLTDGDLDGYTITWTISNDEEGIISVSQSGLARTITAVGEGTVTITVTVEGFEAVTCTVNVVNSSVSAEGVLASETLDFSDPDTYSSVYVAGNDGNLATSSSFNTGMLTYVTSNGSASSVNTNGYLNPNGGTGSGSSAGRYFKIDLSNNEGGYTGNYVTVTVEMCTGVDGSERSLLLSTDSATTTLGSSIAYVTSSSQSERTTLSYTMLINSETELYLTWTANIYIYSVSVVVSETAEVTPAVASVAIDGSDDGIELDLEDEINNTATITVTVTMVDADAEYDGGYTWTTDKASVATVSVNEDGDVIVTAVGAGEATITVMLWNDPSKTASITVTVNSTYVDEREFEVIASIDFSDTSVYTANTVLINDTAEDTQIGETGFYITKCGTSGANTIIDSHKVDEDTTLQYVNFKGQGKTTQNSIYYHLTAGTYQITISYCCSSTDARYAYVISKDSSTQEETTWGADADSDEKTSEAYGVVTRTIEINLEDAADVYIGSYSSALYLISVSIAQYVESTVDGDAN